MKRIHHFLLMRDKPQYMYMCADLFCPKQQLYNPVLWGVLLTYVYVTYVFLQWSQGLSSLRCSVRDETVQQDNNTRSLTNTSGHSSAPLLAVLARCRLLALQTESRRAEELTAGVEVGAVRTLVATVGRHVQFGTADLCQRKSAQCQWKDCFEFMICSV